jgi:hypothetical protein
MRTQEWEVFMPQAISQDNDKLDSASLIAAIIIVVLLFLILWTVNKTLGGMEEAKTLLHILIPIAAIPAFNSISGSLRSKSSRIASQDSHTYRNLFSSAFTISLLIMFLFELMSFLAALAAGVALAGLNITNNTQALGVTVQAIGLFVNLPLIFLCCVTLGWLLGQVRVQRPFRFAAYFTASLAILSLADALYSVFNEDARTLLAMEDTSGIASYMIIAVVVRPAFLAIALLLGFFLKYLWRSLFGGNPLSAGNRQFPL